MGLRRDEIGEAPVRAAIGLLDLLAEEVERREHLSARFVGVQLDVVADAVGGEQAINAASGQQLLAGHVGQKFLCVSEKFAGFFAVPGVIENRRITSAEFPGMEERRPVDEGDEVREGDGKKSGTAPAQGV